MFSKSSGMRVVPTNSLLRIHSNIAKSVEKQQVHLFISSVKRKTEKLISFVLAVLKHIKLLMGYIVYAIYLLTAVSVY